MLPSLLTFLLAAPVLAQPPGKAAPIPVVLAESIGGIRPGMTRADVERSGYKLVPEGIDRLERTGFSSGAILFLFDPQDRVVLISVGLRKSPGLKVGKVFIPPDATLATVGKLIPGCTMAQGSGGNALSCPDPKGRVLSAYDSFGSRDVWVHLGPG